jgi:hypothetical protein
MSLRGMDCSLRLSHLRVTGPVGLGDRALVGLVVTPADASAGFQQSRLGTRHSFCRFVAVLLRWLTLTAWWGDCHGSTVTIRKPGPDKNPGRGIRLQVGSRTDVLVLQDQPPPCSDGGGFW